MQLPDSAEGIRALLLEPWRASLQPGTSVVDKLDQAYKNAGVGAQSDFRRSLAELLQAWETLVDESGEALLYSLELVQRVRVQEARDPLKQLVDERRLTLPVGDYSDLHGRALEALAAIGGLDPLSCWNTEVKYRNYAPLAFSFVRDGVPRSIPTILPDVARLGFLRDALRTVIVRYPEGGLDLVLQCARSVRERRDTELIGKLLDVLPRLGLKANEEARVRKALGFGGPSIRVSVDLGKELDDLVSERLREVGFIVLYPHQSSPDRLGDWSIVQGSPSPGGQHSYAKEGRNRVFEVFDEGDQRPSSESHSPIVVPSFKRSPIEKAEFIRECIVSALRSESSVDSQPVSSGAQAKSVALPSRATLAALAGYPGRG